LSAGTGEIATGGFEDYRGGVHGVEDLVEDIAGEIKSGGGVVGDAEGECRYRNAQLVDGPVEGCIPSMLLNLAESPHGNPAWRTIHWGLTARS
jgi:hypothetical protein